jgi:hypothetical protein
VAGGWVAKSKVVAEAEAEADSAVAAVLAEAVERPLDGGGVIATEHAASSSATEPSATSLM